MTGRPVQGGEGTEAFPNKRECGWWPWCCSLAPAECRGNRVRGGGGDRAAGGPQRLIPEAPRAQAAARAGRRAPWKVQSG